MRRIEKETKFKVEFTLTQESIILIVLDWLEKNPKENAETLTVGAIKNIALDYVITHSMNGVRALDPKLLVKKQDLLVACKGMFS